MTPDEWKTAAPDIRATWAATAIVGPQPDDENVRAAWLDIVLGAPARRNVVRD